MTEVLEQSVTKKSRNIISKQSKIRKLVQDNPRREGTKGFKSFSLIRNGMDVIAYIEDGGRLNDLQHCIKKKYVELY